MASYTDEQKRDALQRLADGEPVGVVANELGCTRVTLYAWADAAGLEVRGRRGQARPQANPRRRRQPSPAEVVARLARGEWAEDLAKEYEVSVSTIGRWRRHAHGGDLRAWDAASKRDVLRLLGDGQTFNNIERRTGVGRFTVMKWAKEVGIVTRPVPPDVKDGDRRCKVDFDTRLEALKRIDRGESIADVAADLGLARTTVYRWLR